MPAFSGHTTGRADLQHLLASRRRSLARRGGGSAADGRLEVFVPGIDGHLWHLYQTSPNGGWSDWEDLGVPRPGVDAASGRVNVHWGPPATVGSAADGR